MDRIPVGDTFATGTCGLKCVAFQWNYYENYKSLRHSRIPGARRVRASVLCTAKSFQLAPCQRRECAVGPRELSYRAHLPSGPEWRQHSCGHKAEKPITIFLTGAEDWNQALQYPASIINLQRLCLREHVMETTYVCDLPPA